MHGVIRGLVRLGVRRGDPQARLMADPAVRIVSLTITEGGYNVTADGDFDATAPALVAAGNIGCITQIASGTTLPVVHTVELLDWATGDFELVATAPGRTSAGLSVTYALIEHARICDERAARKYVA